MILVRMRHVRQAGMCGGRVVRRHVLRLGLNWSQFLRHGLPIDELRGIDDVLVRQVVAAADKEARGGA